MCRVRGRDLFHIWAQPRTQDTFRNESTLVDRGHALLPRFWAIKQFVIVFSRCS